ncbi:MAG: preprotein translocase subunit SecG [Elusimicrobia bacterium]|nr:preprotein translocase subunit SecG [Elusimicrobiota bacterium]
MLIYAFIRVLHIVACILMIMVVLLQTGRGAGLSVFGGSGDSLITTPTGSSFMKNVTTGLACLFAFTSLFLTLLSSRSGMSSVTGRTPLSPPPAAAPPVPPGVPPTPPAPPDK